MVKKMDEGIRRVVWLPKKLDEEIEKTRQKIGYTRSGFYRYAITRFLEQILLTKQKELHLQPWQEITGTLKEIKADEEITTAIITCTQHTDYIISYPNQTKEAETLQTLKNQKGQKVAILRTDQSILIRNLKEPAATSKVFWRSLPVRSSLLWVAFKQLIAFNITLWQLGLR
jgi:metal-responsive CopG/Arc/MetJ family transcriptional regulator